MTENKIESFLLKIKVSLHNHSFKLVFQSSRHLQGYTKSNSMKFRSSSSQMFFKIGALQRFALFTGKHLCWNLFLIKLQTFNTYFERTPLVTASRSCKVQIKRKISCMISIQIFSRDLKTFEVTKANKYPKKVVYLFLY